MNSAVAKQGAALRTCVGPRCRGRGTRMWSTVDRCPWCSGETMAVVGLVVGERNDGTAHLGQLDRLDQWSQDPSS